MSVQSENIADTITAITVFTPAIKKLTENARKTVFEDPLEAIVLKLLSVENQSFDH